VAALRLKAGHACRRIDDCRLSPAGRPGTTAPLSANSKRARWPVSRVLSPDRDPVDDHSSGTPVARRLARHTRVTARKTRLPVQSLRIGRPATPTWSCSRWGLPCQRRYRRRGALLPHPFTLAWRTPAEAGRAVGGLLSVALSLRSPSPGVTRHRVFRGARTFLSRRERSGAAIQPSGTGRGLRCRGRCRQWQAADYLRNPAARSGIGHAIDPRRKPRAVLPICAIREKAGSQRAGATARSKTNP